MFKPQLLTSAPVDTISSFIQNDEWCLQEKMDGIRCVAIIAYDIPGVEFVTRGGRPLVSTMAKPLLPSIESELRDISVPNREVILDGELIPSTGEFYIFDLPSETYPLDTRLDALDVLFNDIQSKRVRLSPTARTTEEKQTLFEQVLLNRGEGLVAKKVNEYYHEGERVPHSVKLKFTRTADLVVLDKNRGDSTKSIRGGLKQNYIVGHPVDGVLREVANVSAIGRAEMNKGDIVEVEYLYVGTRGRLVQPRIVGPRPDKTIEDIDIDQFA